MKQLDNWNKELDKLSSRRYKKMDSDLYNHYKDTLKQLKIEIKGYVDNYEKLSFSKRLEVENQIKMTERIDEILSDLSGKTGPTVSEYVREELQRGYYGTWYALEGAENVQLDFGMLPEKYIEQLVNKKVDGKNFSKRLYEHRDELAERVTTALLNGAARGEGYAKVAKNIGELTESNYKQALRIARTEGGRTQAVAKQRAYKEAKEKGVNLKKQWMSTLDKKTRHSHQELDGQIVEVDEKFAFNGYEADGPRLFGVPSLDINCRCTTISVVNGIAPELRKDNITKETIEYTKYSDWYGSKKVQNEIGKQKYTEYVSVLSKKYNTKNFGKILDKMSDKEYEKLGILDISDNEIEFIPKNTFDADKLMNKTNMKSMVGDENYKQFISHLNKVEDKQIKDLFAAYGEKVTFSKINNGTAYARRSDVQLIHKNFTGTDRKPPLQTVYHELGHAFDSLGLEKVTGKKSIATGNQIKRKILRKNVTVDETVEHITGHPKYSLKESIQRDIWEHVNGKDLPMKSDLGAKPRKKSEKEEWFNKQIEISKKSEQNFIAFEEAIKKEYEGTPTALGGLSDIYESTGFSTKDYPFGSGHGSKYWKEAGKAETEFIAHYIESIATNADSYELLNKIFPNSIGKIRTIIDDMLKASD